MTPCVVKQEGASLLFNGVKVTITGPAESAFRIEEIPVTDTRLKSSWGSRLCRVIVAWNNAPAAGTLLFSVG
jgi:hypothetical protein